MKKAVRKTEIRPRRLKKSRPAVRRERASEEPIVSPQAPRIVVKLRDDVALPHDDRVVGYLDSSGIGRWRELESRFPGITIRRLINSVTPARIRALVARAQRLDDSYRAPNFLAYFAIYHPDNIDPEKVVASLRTFTSVAFAYVDPPAKEPELDANDARTYVSDPRLPEQGYLRAAPAGIDAEFAWTQAGGDAAGQQFIDLERGWTLNHQDLDALSAGLLFGDIRDQSRPHGTSVLGVVCAVRNQFLHRGIAYGLDSANVVSYFGGCNSVPNAIFAALDHLDFGGVLLLEVERQLRPVELWQADFDAIKLVTTSGITVVEAAGNGDTNLDNLTDLSGTRVLTRGARDSGAVLVAGATSQQPHERGPLTNYGTRIDCYAWGENVAAPSSTTTPDYSIVGHTKTFDGTSSASAIIAGAALVLQGIATVRRGQRFGSSQLRALLADPALGTHSNAQADLIGSMPDLRAIINSLAPHRIRRRSKVRPP